MVKDDHYKQIFQLWRSERKTNKLLEVKGSLYSAIRQRISSFEKELESIDSKDVISTKIISERIERLKRILHESKVSFPKAFFIQPSAPDPVDLLLSG